MTLYYNKYYIILQFTFQIRPYLTVHFKLHYNTNCTLSYKLYYIILQVILQVTLHYLTSYITSYITLWYITCINVQETKIVDIKLKDLQIKSIIYFIQVTQYYVTIYITSYFTSDIAYFITLYLSASYRTRHDDVHISLMFRNAYKQKPINKSA